MENSLNYDYDNPNFDTEKANEHILAMDVFAPALTLPQEQLDVYLELRDKIVELMKEYHTNYQSNKYFELKVRNLNAKCAKSILWSVSIAALLVYLTIQEVEPVMAKMEVSLDNTLFAMAAFVAIIGVMLPAAIIARSNTVAYREFIERTHKLGFIDRMIEKYMGTAITFNAMSNRIDFLRKFEGLDGPKTTFN